MDLYDTCWIKESKNKIDTFYIKKSGIITKTVASEIKTLLGAAPAALKDARLTLKISKELHREAFIISNKKGTAITAGGEEGLLYGFYELLRRLACGHDVNTESKPINQIRMLDHWDNLDGSIERGYAGGSIFFDDGAIKPANGRIRDYARLLASVGINAVSINNVNVRRNEARLIAKPLLDSVFDIAEVFGRFGIKLFLSVNFASPIILGGLTTADPLKESVIKWWQDTVDDIYKEIPYFGGFIIKADSEGEPGPFAYGRDHADGANCIAKALAAHNALLIWRCFVYNCNQDWRDRKTDRARAAYDTFKPLDGLFLPNVALQVKNGPVDFQVREPVSQLFGALPNTNVILEFQVTQEYTGQQKHICYLAPMWKEVIDFKTYAPGAKTAEAPVRDIIARKEQNGVTAVSNIGNDYNWTGHKLAQANLYALGRLAWDPGLTSESILMEWITQTFDLKTADKAILFDIMINSRETYEKYTAPLGVGWMVKPSHHYGPDVDGYEYDRWGTYHFADRNGLGVDRTKKTGTGFADTYFKPNSKIYEDRATCPDNLILFFHHLPYTHVLKSGKTVIQHIYDAHFEGCEEVLAMIEKWKSLEGKINDRDYLNVLSRLEEQERSAKEWRDQINTYFYRKSGIEDIKGRKIYA